MEDKIYNLSPFQILDKLYQGNLKGFKESEINEAEKRLNIKIPKVLRQYYIKYGLLNINSCLHRILTPSELNFSYDEIDDLDEDEIKEYTDNYFMFWIENQGVWYTGIKEEDIYKSDPPIYITTNDDLFEWALCSNSTYSFLLSIIIEQIYDSEFYYESILEDEIYDAIKSLNINIDYLILKDNFPFNNIHCATCWDTSNKTLYAFTHENNKIKSMLIIHNQLQ